MERRRRWGWAVGIVACAWLAWAGTLRVGFIWDDHYTIQANPTLRAWSWANLKRDVTTGLFNDPRETDFYRPLVAVVNRIDYTLYGQRAWGYHLTNLLIHTGSSLLVALLLTQLGFSSMVAGLTACLFAVHPINAQDMILITGRCGLLGMFFTLLALVECQSAESVWIGVVAYALGLGAKESVAIVPALYALTLWLRRRAWDKSVWRAFAAMALVTLGYLVLHRQVGMDWPASLTATHGLRFMLRVFPGVLCAYAGLVAAPILLYSDRIVPQSAVHGLWLFALMVIIGVGFYRRRTRWPFFAYGWVVLLLLPPVPVMMSQRFMLDHWAYPALPGFLLPLAMALAAGGSSTRAVWRKGAGLCAVVLILAGAGLAEWNVALRGTDLRFFQWSARYSPSETIHNNLQALVTHPKR